ncbi:MAG: hypothetical protein ABTQ32_25665 [Myxococcaceae bacterium]
MKRAVAIVALVLSVAFAAYGVSVEVAGGGVKWPKTIGTSRGL